MSASLRMTQLLWITTVIVLAAAGMRWRDVTRSDPATGRAIPLAGRASERWTFDSLSVWADLAYQGDIFRLTRRPSDVGFSREPAGIAPPPPRPPKPLISLAGIIGGPPWQAVLEGIPGREEPFVAWSGERIGDLRVSRVGRDTVVVVGFDTTWKLTVRRTWK